MITIQSSQPASLRIYLDDELFIDQTLPWPTTKLTADTENNLSLGVCLGSLGLSIESNKFDKKLVMQVFIIRYALIGQAELCVHPS